MRHSVVGATREVNITSFHTYREEHWPNLYTGLALCIASFITLTTLTMHTAVIKPYQMHTMHTA